MMLCLYLSQSLLFHQQMHGRDTERLTTTIPSDLEKVSLYTCVQYICCNQWEGKSASLCKFRKYSLTDLAQCQSLGNVTTLGHSKIHHPQLSPKMQNLMREYIGCARTSKTVCRPQPRRPERVANAIKGAAKRQ